MYTTERKVRMKKETLQDQAYKILKERIIYCTYPPGSFLNENMLVQDLSFSRTPIRGALARLEQENWIRILPKKGILVTEISLDDVRQIFQVRKELEPVALKLSTPYLKEEELLKFQTSFLQGSSTIEEGLLLDTRMHLLFIENCGNRFIVDTMKKVFEENTRVIIFSKQNEVQIHDARQEHLNILELLFEKKFTEATEYLRFHIEQCEDAAMRFFYHTPLKAVSS